MATAYVLINCQLGKEGCIIENLKHIDSVKEVHGTFGAYDVIAKIENDQKDKVRETVTWSIRKMEDVRSTLTLMGIEGQN
ncbi:Lrp/AsnC ligand binding domain-containing protein [Nitrosopumilus sp. K4]|uniref:Lrp/AsnC ligand binding domain-containing protein n=1 Tax=Nitrosopumilus sp. K4 TaxID=2795383 RepID=UPI001BA76E34|nr:Lrp/AsnC ligand binding domain-containing protein [Nitrosopumilus sp. K4]QUC64138.1 Lrp/AsnC ligand binding domain-containing protein [Nitrosopumilus sp. K4]